MRPRRMRILVIGAAGMLGGKLVDRLVRDGSLGSEGISQLTLVDRVVAAPPGDPGFVVESTVADLAEPGAAGAIVAGRPDVIFHLAAVVSGEAEDDLEKGYRVNLDATRMLLDAIRADAPGYRPRVVYSSSIAVFGPPFPDVIGDDHCLTPATSYGTQKAMIELLLSDHSRRGFADGTAIRLPTICVRPGRPNLAASGFFSSIIRDRRRIGPGKTDPGDAHAIAQVVLRCRDALGPALEPELVRALGLLELQRHRLVRDRTQAIQRLRSTWQQVDPVAEARTVRCERQRELRKLKRIRFGDGLADTIAAGIVRELARDIDALNQRISELDAQIAALLDEHGNPVADLLGAGNQIAAALIAHAGDVRRFRDAAAFARFCGAAPIPCGSGQTSGRHRLHRGGNRQLNAALYRIAIVQQRHHPAAKAFLARKIAEGKTPRQARRALKRHLANIVYRRLLAWAHACPAMNDLT
jgi:nucleoside-diphosphate-sugar epimerase